MIVSSGTVLNLNAPERYGVEAERIKKWRVAAGAEGGAKKRSVLKSANLSKMAFARLLKANKKKRLKKALTTLGHKRYPLLFLLLFL